MKKIFIQCIKFIGISGIGWIIDFIIYNVLNIFIPYVQVSNMISSLVAVTFVFIVSTRKTFTQNENGINIKLKFAAYIIYQILLIICISFVLAWISEFIKNTFTNTILGTYSAILAKIIVTPVTMVCNFIVMKFLIERF